MSLDTLTWTVIAANILGAAMAVPQAVKLLRSRHAAGVSPGWAGMSATVNAWWGAYGLGVGEWSIVPVSFVSVMSYLVIAVAIVRYRAGSATSVLLPLGASTVLIGLVPVAALALGGWATAGVTLGALYGVQLSPAVVEVYRSVDVSGVSVATWAMALVEALLWGVYGIARLDAGLLALAITGTIMSSVVLVRLAMRRPRRDRRDDYVGIDLAFG